MKIVSGFPGTKSWEESLREREHREIARRVGAEGIVLLENDGTLPLSPGSPIALYGVGARHTIMGGTGSGKVNCRPGVTIEEGLNDAGFVITNKAWLDELDRRYEEGRKDWMRYLYDNSIPGNFESLYRIHASTSMPAPEGETITREGDADTALYVISRISGEGADREMDKGDYLLSDIEREQIRQMCDAYEHRILVLNVGGVIDLSFLEEYPISAVVLLSQAGMEGGHALADVLSGRVNPSGRLAETWADSYEDYPCSDTFSYQNRNLIEEKYWEGIYVGYRWFDSFEIKPRYPFGYGLSYTTFSQRATGLRATEEGVILTTKVRNKGERAGKDTVLLFAACPSGLRRKERKRLVAFAKTPLLKPGDEAEVILSFSYDALASYHGGKACWYLDAGSYRLLLAKDALHMEAVGTLSLEEAVFGESYDRICPLQDSLKEFLPPEEAEKEWEKKLNSLFAAPSLPVLGIDQPARKAMELYSRPLLPEAGEEKADDPLLAQLTLEEKACLVCGRPREGEASFIGSAGIHVAGAAGETTSILEKKGIPPLIMADGPAGIRVSMRYEVDEKRGRIYGMTPYESLQNRIFGTEFPHEGAGVFFQFCTAIPVGMSLAQTFDTALVEEAGRLVGREMQEFGITLWLAPGMNIKRNPLNGRNFEYFSEDPLLSGRMAAAITRSVQSCPGAGVTIKHFACNNQEDNRRGVSAILSERALREIYLKGFEIAVREEKPWAIMTSYNRINGVHTANSRDLCTIAARKEWGFDGIIMTDWTTTNRDGGSSAAKCISAGNDLVMPGTMTDIQEIMEAVLQENDQCLDIQDLDRSCERILHLIRTLCMDP